MSHVAYPGVTVFEIACVSTVYPRSKGKGAVTPVNCSG